MSDSSPTQSEINQQILEIIKNMQRVETLHQEMLSEFRERLRRVEDLITSKEQV